MSGEPSAEYLALADLLPDVVTHPDHTIEQVRATFAELHGHDPGDDVVLESTDRGIWVRAIEPLADNPVLFFVHGGGFVTSPAASYTFYAANLVRACQTQVFMMS